MGKKYQYFNRDISWLSFNHRVLEEARDTGLPLYERLKCLAIYSSNLDEFYKVRVAEYRNAAESGVSLPDISDPAAVLKQINTLVTEQLIEFRQKKKKELLEELQENNIILYEHNMPEHPDHQEFMKDYFYTEIIPFLRQAG